LFFSETNSENGKEVLRLTTGSVLRRNKQALSQDNLTNVGRK